MASGNMMYFGCYFQLAFARQISTGRWIQKIDDFGQGRGEFAHRAGRALQPIDPQDDYRTVTAIAEGIREIDALLTAMKYHSFPLAVE